MTDWQIYYNQHLARPPRPLLVEAISYCKDKQNALDLGAGTLIETKLLLDNDFDKVVAVDSSPEIDNFAKSINDDRLEVKVASYQNLDLASESYDLITAQYALPFYGKKGFDGFIERLKSSLNKGGVFTGQFFGDRDEWNVSDKNMVFQTKDEALKLLSGFSVKKFEEEEKDSTVASGEPKHWHVFHFIAIK